MKKNNNIKKNGILAINGGKPVRRKPFAPPCFAGEKEKKLLLECLKSNRWSSFRGSKGAWNIKKLCKITSEEAAKYGPLEMLFLGGKYVRKLEAIFAKQFNTRYAVSCNSATSGLIMALGALNLGPKDEVIVPCMSFNATATSILFFNSIPVFAEVKEDTFCIDPENIKSKITERTKAILVVHLGGNAADMDRIMAIAKSHKLKVIEDSAQAPGVTYNGRPVGTIGDVGIFSFTESKNITCGEGGMLVTDSPEIAFKARLIRNHGEGVAENSWKEEELVNIVGMNFRLTELQAAIAIPQLQSLTARNRIRKQNARYLIKSLKRYPELIPPAIEKGADYVPYILKWKYIPSPDMPDRDSLSKALVAEGIPVIKGFPRLMHENPVFSRKIAYGRNGCPYTGCGYKGSLRYGWGTCPRSEKINEEFLWFQYIHPPNTKKDMNGVVKAFGKILGVKRNGAKYE